MAQHTTTHSGAARPASSRPANCDCGTGLSRRQFAAALVTLGGAAMVPRIAYGGEEPTLIDTHHHFYPPEYQKAWLDWEESRKVPHFATQVAWTREKSLEEMDKAGIRTAILAPVDPGPVVRRRP